MSVEFRCHHREPDRNRRARPRTDEEWAALRRSAVQLVEATNLLRIPGRLVAKPGEKSENPRIELQPETIQKMIAEDPAGWAAWSIGCTMPPCRP